MGWNRVKPNPKTIASILSACSDLKDSKSGKTIHGFVGVSLFSHMSRVELKQMKLHRALLLVGCVENGRINEALEMLRKIQNMGFKPNEITISSILPACFISGSLRMGKEIYTLLSLQAFESLGLDKNSSSSIHVCQMR
ncbi:PPR domain protein [Medicago truncatula]|uniref:PPR domain protein n=1 Tax=Medicago truncatula TaxID=3880 RepID=A0A072V9V2_MEDTR|nr:PPR domain protein [Medicago truncatula]